MAFIEQHDAKITDTALGNTKHFWRLINGKKFVSPKFDYPILFGVELEYEVITPRDIAGVDARRLYRAQVANRLEWSYKDFAITKHDGSLKNGFEVVSVPMSLDAHSEEWKPFLDNASENGLAVRTTCGMHVHVSRELLTPLHIGKIMAFVHNKSNAELIRAIAGRSKPVYTGTHGEYVDIPTRKITDVNREYNRYSALNLRGSETIEFRLFKSTLSLNRILANIEFCDALVRFMWPGSNSSIQQLQKNGLKLFSEYVLQNRKRFRHLAEFMKEEGYISWKKVPMKYQKKEETKSENKVEVKPIKRKRKTYSAFDEGII